jgi:hypothetical protein
MSNEQPSAASPGSSCWCDRGSLLRLDDATVFGEGVCRFVVVPDLCESLSHLADAVTVVAHGRRSFVKRGSLIGVSGPSQKGYR